MIFSVLTLALALVAVVYASRWLNELRDAWNDLPFDDEIDDVDE